MGLHLFYGFIYFSETKWMQIFFLFFNTEKKGICAAFQVDPAETENLLPYFWPYLDRFHAFFVKL